MTFIGQFGFKSGRDIDKFANVQYELGPTGAPLIKDWSIAAFDAKVVRTLEMRATCFSSARCRARCGSRRPRR